MDQERMESYPALPGSVMHYVHAARSQADFPGYQEQFNRYKEASEETVRQTLDSPAPQMINFARIVNIFAVTKRKWAAQEEFTELVLGTGDQCVIGYWPPDYHKARTLDTLCADTIGAALLTREPHKADFYFHFHYDELNDEGSDLWKYVRGCVEGVEEMRRQRGLPEMSAEHLLRSLWCIYLLDFTPADIDLVKKKFPGTRIIGITTPTVGRNDEDTILRVKAQMRAAAVAATKAAMTQSEKKQ